MSSAPLPAPPSACAPAPDSTLAERILEHTAEAVIFVNRQGLIDRWNAAAAAMFGRSRSEALGASLDLIIPEHLRAAHWRGFDAAMASGHTHLHGRATLTRGLHPSGRKLYLEMSFALVFGDSGQAIGSVAVARDVSERVERERQLAAANAANAANAAQAGKT